MAAKPQKNSAKFLGSIDQRVIRAVQAYSKPWSSNGGLTLSEIVTATGAPCADVQTSIGLLVTHRLLTYAVSDITGARRYYIKRPVA